MTDEQFVFVVEGPFEVPFEDEPGGRSIDGDSGRALFQDPEAEGLRASKGCYVFGMRTSRGYVTPWYVGKTTKGDYETECFTPHKLVKYNRALTKVGRGTPVLFFIVHPRSRGKPNAEAIDQLETFLIQLAAVSNSALLNDTKKEGRWWSIRGFEGHGRPSRAARALARALGQI